MSPHPTVSVVIPSYNYGRYISQALEGVLAQTQPPAEIVVVDDGSTDETEEVVRGFESQGVRYIGQENSGVCAARNRGVAESSGEFIAFLDADDFWEPTKLERQLAKFESNEEIGLVHCGMREFDSATGDTIKICLDGGEIGVAEKLLLWNEPSINVSGSIIMVKRLAFEAVGGFDTRISCGEDWDFCYRVARKYNVGFVPEALVNYRIHGAAAHRNVDNMEMGMARFYWKAFDTDDPEVLKLKNRALGNYHRVMAGSFFQAGRLGRFASHAVRSIGYRPANLGYFLSYPIRRLKHS